MSVEIDRHNTDHNIDNNTIQMSIKHIRLIKRLIFKYRLLVIGYPLFNILMTIAYLCKLSKWIDQQERKFDDFGDWNYNKRYDLYSKIIQLFSLDTTPINYIELGVSQGHSLRFWINSNYHPNSIFYGFDTFEGLPEDWGGFERGAMKANIPKINDSRVVLYKGLFQDTLHPVVSSMDNNRKVILMDADCFTSTLYALSIIGPYLNDGDIILFDQFNIPLHEFRAFDIFKECFMLNFQLIEAMNNYYFCAFILKRKEEK